MSYIIPWIFRSWGAAASGDGLYDGDAIFSRIFDRNSMDFASESDKADGDIFGSDN